VLLDLCVASCRPRDSVALHSFRSKHDQEFTWTSIKWSQSGSAFPEGFACFSTSNQLSWSRTVQKDCLDRINWLQLHMLCGFPLGWLLGMLRSESSSLSSFLRPKTPVWLIARGSHPLRPCSTGELRVRPGILQAGRWPFYADSDDRSHRFPSISCFLRNNVAFGQRNLIAVAWEAVGSVQVSSLDTDGLCSAWLHLPRLPRRFTSSSVTYRFNMVPAGHSNRLHSEEWGLRLHLSQVAARLCTRQFQSCVLQRPCLIGFRYRSRAPSIAS
jgi:hypothetical protein